MKIKFKNDYSKVYDWIIIPTIMIGFRDNEWSDTFGYVTGFGLAVLFLKFKFQLLILKE